MVTDFTPRRLSQVLTDVGMYGLYVDSERGATYEFEDFLFKLDDPRDRIATESWRKMNIGFAIIDALSHIVGDNRVEPLLQFVPGFIQYSSNGKTIDGSYGARIHMNGQIHQVIKMLKENPMTRRAVISIYQGPLDLNGFGGVNTPCTLNFHFLVRNKRLHMKVMMRSNDVILGLTNDIFTFTMFHEYISAKTGIPLGDYTHFASSFHVYEKDLKTINYEQVEQKWPYVMKSMPSDFNPSKVYDHLCNLHRTPIQDAFKVCEGSPYERNLYLASATVYFRKQPGAYDLAKQITDLTLRKVAMMWVKQKEAVS